MATSGDGLTGASEFDDFLAAVVPLLPRGWGASLQLEDPLTHTLEQVAASRSAGRAGEHLALSRLPEGFTDPPPPWLVQRLGLSALRLFGLAGERPFGRLLLLAAPEAPALDRDREARIAELCTSFAVSLERGRSHREEEKFSQRLRRITEQELSARFAEVGLQLLPALAIAVLGRRGDALSVLMARQRQRGVLEACVGRQVPLLGSHLSAIVEQGAPARLPTPSFLRWTEGAALGEALAGVGGGIVETVPLEPRGRLLGSLLLLHEDELAAAAARQPVNHLAEELALALDRIRPERHQATTLLYLHELFRAPGRAIGALLRTVVEEMVRFLGADAGLLALLDADTGRLLLSETRGYEGAVLPESLPLHPEREARLSITAQVARSGEPYLASDTRGAPIYLPADPSIRSELGVPLRLRGETFGVALSSSRSAGFFTTEDIGRLQLFADQVAVAVDNARLLESLRARQAREGRRRQRREFGFDPADHAGDVEYHFGNLVGQTSGPMGEVYRMIERVASREEETVLIVGETGTGKEMIAHAIHQASSRRRRPMVATNLAALGGDPNLIQSELFGHERGAFTGAAGRRRGCFESAHRSTLFIDEVGDIVPSVQVKLLRVLGRSSERAFVRLGGEEGVRSDVRVLAATNKDLSQEIRAGRFREDLYYRLSALVIRLPPLRARAGDIPLLMRHVLVRLARGERIRVGRGAEQVLAAYHWPGNVRQLESAILRALVLYGHPQEVTADDLARALEAEERGAIAGRAPALLPPEPPPEGWFWDNVWKPWKTRRLPAAALEELVRRCLTESGGFYSRVARRLGVAPAEYQRFLDFLDHAGAKLDHRPFRAPRPATAN